MHSQISGAALHATFRLALAGAFASAARGAAGSFRGRRRCASATAVASPTDGESPVEEQTMVVEDG